MLQKTALKVTERVDSPDDLLAYIVLLLTWYEVVTLN